MKHIIALFVNNFIETKLNVMIKNEKQNIQFYIIIIFLFFKQHAFYFTYLNLFELIIPITLPVFVNYIIQLDYLK